MKLDLVLNSADRLFCTCAVYIQYTYVTLPLNMCTLRIDLFVYLFVWWLTTHNPCGSLASDGIKLNMMWMEKVKNYRIKIK